MIPVPSGRRASPVREKTGTRDSGNEAVSIDAAAVVLDVRDRASGDTVMPSMLPPGEPTTVNVPVIGLMSSRP